MRNRAANAAAITGNGRMLLCRAPDPPSAGDACSSERPLSALLGAAVPPRADRHHRPRSTTCVAQLDLARSDSQLAGAAAATAPAATGAGADRRRLRAVGACQALADEITRATGGAPTHNVDNRPARRQRAAAAADRRGRHRRVAHVGGQDAGELAARLSGYRAGLLGSIAASCTAAYTVALAAGEGAVTSAEPTPTTTRRARPSRPARRDPPTPPTPRCSTRSPTEHATIYGYGIVSAHCHARPQRPGVGVDRRAPRAREEAIAMLGGRSVDATAARGRLPAADRRSTTRPMPPTWRSGWKRTPRSRGGRCSSRRPPIRMRAFAVTALTQCAVTAARWSQVLERLADHRGVPRRQRDSHLARRNSPSRRRPSSRQLPRRPSSRGLDGISRVSPVNRLRSSTTPSAQPRPTTTIHGTPSSSASLNFTPGEACRSSSSTSTPSRSRSAASSAAPARAAPSLLAITTWASNGDTDDGQRRPELVVMLLGDHRDQSGHPDAVGAHGQPHRLAVLAEHIGGERVGVLAAELEDVADLDAARGDQRAGAVG